MRAMGGNLSCMNFLGANGCTEAECQAHGSACAALLERGSNTHPIGERRSVPPAPLSRGVASRPGHIRATAAGAMLSGAPSATWRRMFRPGGIQTLRSPHPESATSEWRLTNAWPAPRAERAGTLHPLRPRATVFSMRAGRLAEPGRRQIAGHPFSNTLASPSAVPTARRRSALFSLPVLTWPAGFGRRAVFSGVRTHA
jgi:hypothetical protein